MLPPDIRHGNSLGNSGNPDLQRQRYNYDQVPNSDLHRFLEHFEDFIRARMVGETIEAPTARGLLEEFTDAYTHRVYSLFVFLRDRNIVDFIHDEGKKKLRLDRDNFRAVAAVTWAILPSLRDYHGFKDFTKGVVEARRGLGIDSLAQKLHNGSERKTDRQRHVVVEGNVPTRKRRSRVSLGEQGGVIRFDRGQVSESNAGVAPRENLIHSVAAQRKEGSEINKSVVERMPQLTPHEWEELEKLDEQLVLGLADYIPDSSDKYIDSEFREGVPAYLAQVFRYVESFYAAIVHQRISRLREFDIDQVNAISLQDLKHCIDITSTYMRQYPQLDNLKKLFMAITKKVEQDFGSRR